MPKNDEGEFELVLGNRQLLSGFFIVVILFGVFFAMGYIIGRHSSAESVAGPPITAVLPPSPAASTPSGNLPPGEAEVVSAAKPEVPSVVVPAEAPAEEPPKVTEAASKAAEEPVAPGLTVPTSGKVYIQVRMGQRPAVGGVIDALKRKGIQAFLAPGPDANTVRVLVGPFEDTSLMAKTRTEVQDAGFKDAFPKRF
jgi:DedD protein